MKITIKHAVFALMVCLFVQLQFGFVHAVEVSPSVEAMQALKKLAETEKEYNRMVIEDSAQLLYLKASPQERESRNSLLNYSAIAQSFLSGDVETRSSRAVKNGVQFKNQILQIFMGNKPAHLFSWSFDGRNAYSHHTDYATPDTLQISNGTISSSKSGSTVLGTYLSQGKVSLIGKPVLNGVQTIHIESIVKSGKTAIRYQVWLAPERSYQMVREDMEISFNGTEYNLRTNRKEILDFVKFRNIWVPKKWVSVDWLTNRQGQKHYQSLDINEILQIRTLPSVQQSVFAIDFPVGTAITNDKRNTAYIEGGEIAAYIAQMKKKELPKELQDFIKRVVADNVATTGAAKPQ